MVTHTIPCLLKCQSSAISSRTPSTLHLAATIVPMPMPFSPCIPGSAAPFTPRPTAPLCGLYIIRPYPASLPLSPSRKSSLFHLNPSEKCFPSYLLKTLRIFRFRRNHHPKAQLACPLGHAPNEGSTFQCWTISLGELRNVTSKVRINQPDR